MLPTEAELTEESMSKVVYGKLSEGKVFDKSLVKEERVRDKVTGKITTIRTIKMDPATFGDAFTQVFRKNVAKARRDNKRLLGVADVEPASNPG
jgi:hypothetical protein